jgi:hypothetical protein
VLELMEEESPVLKPSEELTPAFVLLEEESPVLEPLGEVLPVFELLEEAVAPCAIKIPSEDGIAISRFW